MYVTPDAHESPSAVQCRSGARIEGETIPSTVEKFEYGTGRGSGVAFRGESAVPVTSHESSNVAEDEGALASRLAVVVVEAITMGVVLANKSNAE